MEAGHAGGIPERRLPSTAMAWTEAPSVSLPLSPFSSISSIKPQPYPVGSRFAGGDERAGRRPSAADYACIQTHTHTLRPQHPSRNCNYFSTVCRLRQPGPISLMHPPPHSLQTNPAFGLMAIDVIGPHPHTMTQRGYKDVSGWPAR